MTTGKTITLTIWTFVGRVIYLGGPILDVNKCNILFLYWSLYHYIWSFYLCGLEFIVCFVYHEYCYCLVTKLYLMPMDCVACHAPLFMEFSRQEYWSEWPLPPSGNLPNPGVKPKSLLSPVLSGGFFYHYTSWEAQIYCWPYTLVISICMKYLSPLQSVCFVLKWVPYRQFL